MRKALLAGIFVLCVGFCSASASEAVVASKITKVTVYPDAALVTRRGTVAVDSGAQTVSFEGIVPEIDGNSIKVSAQSGVAVKLFGAQLLRKAQAEVPAADVQKLRDRLRETQDLKRQLNDQKAVLSQVRRFIDSFQFYSQNQLPKDLATKMPDPAELDGICKFIDGRLKENYSGVMELDMKIRDADERIRVLEHDLEKISGPVEAETKIIKVELEAAQAGTVDISVSYLVRGGASWAPVYDARASFDNAEIELVCYGMVMQKTGEDWFDAELTLSTANPSVGGNLPYVSPWVLRPAQPAVPMHMRRKADMSRDTVFQEKAFESSNEMLAGAAVPAVVAYAQAQERGTAIVYSIGRRITVKADGNQHKLPVFADTLKAAYEYSTYPRAVNLAYLGSRVSNSDEHQILPGQVSIFLDGEFVGVSSLHMIAPSEKFDLYLGADENVKVERRLVEKKVDETILGIPSPNKATAFSYKITVENYKSRPVAVKLFESMPVSENDKIKVKFGKVSAEPSVKDWEARKGVWLWDMVLQPKEKKEVSYSFTVEHPREMPLEGL